MSKISNVSIIGSFFALWIDSYFDNSTQIYIGFALIFSIGILHGANDLALIKNIIDKNKNTSFVKILIYYAIVVSFGVILFYAVPVLALLLFIIVSGYHFGEQHWDAVFENKSDTTTSFELIYGTTILFLLFSMHSIEVTHIVFLITNAHIPSTIFLQTLYVLTFLLTVFGCILFQKSTNFRKNILVEIFHLLVFAIVFYASNLIWGFAIYFILWHSFPSLIDQIKFLYGSFSFKNFIIYFKAAFLYWFVALLGIALLYYFFRDQQLFNALFFSFLAAITFPHALVILKMFNKKHTLPK